MSVNGTDRVKYVLKPHETQTSCQTTGCSSIKRESMTLNQHFNIDKSNRRIQRKYALTFTRTATAMFRSPYTVFN